MSFGIMFQIDINSQLFKKSFFLGNVNELLKSFATLIAHFLSAYQTGKVKFTPPESYRRQ